VVGNLDLALHPLSVVQGAWTLGKINMRPVGVRNQRWSKFRFWPQALWETEEMYTQLQAG